MNIRFCSDGHCCYFAAGPCKYVPISATPFVIKICIKGDSGMCDVSIPITDNLFGYDLPKALKELHQSNMGKEFRGLCR